MALRRRMLRRREHSAFGGRRLQVNAADKMPVEPGGWPGWSPRRPSRPEQGRRPQEPERDGVLLPAVDLGFQRRGADDLHHAGGADQMAVPGLRPRPLGAQRLPRRPRRHRQGPHGAAQSAALPARGRHGRVHREGVQPDGQAADAARCGSRSPRRSPRHRRTSCSTCAGGSGFGSATRRRHRPSRTSTSRPRNRAGYAWRITCPTAAGS